MFGNLKKKLAALAEKITQKAEETPQEQRAQEIEAIKQAVQGKPEETKKEEAKQAEPETGTPEAAKAGAEAEKPTEAEAKEPEASKEEAKGPEPAQEAAKEAEQAPEAKKAEEIQKPAEPEKPAGEMVKKGLSLKERLAALKRKAKGETEEAKPGIKEKPAEQKEEAKPAIKITKEPERKPEPTKTKPEPTKPEPAEEKAPEPPKEKPAEKKGLLDLIFGGKIEKEAPKKDTEERSFGQKIIGAITEATISEKDLEEIVDEFQIALLENDVALDVSEKMCADIKKELSGKKVRRTEIESAIRRAIKDSLEDVLSRGGKSIDLVETVKLAEKPYKIAFVGINGTGKTTTIAKLAWLLKENGLEPVIAASDTFRAASIEQLEQHTNKLGVKLIKHKYGADAAAVAFDAVEHAKAKGKAAVLIDTAGRMQTNTNLMDELKKIIRVIKPDLVIFVGDSLTGNDAIEQARTFNEARVDAIILTKADADAKGGACLSIAYEIGKPILYLGTGQNYPDLTRFTPEWFIEKVAG